MITKVAFKFLCCVATLLAVHCGPANKNARRHLGPRAQRGYFTGNPMGRQQQVVSENVAANVSNVFQNERRMTLRDRLQKRQLGTGEGCYMPSDYESLCMAMANLKRAVHDSPYLKYDAEVTAYSKWRAHTLATTEVLEHIEMDKMTYPEILAWHPDKTADCSKSINLWYEEEQYFHYDCDEFSMKTGHFTALVWRSTYYMGCGEAIGGPKLGGLYVVCSFRPWVNARYEYAKNVKPPWFRWPPNEQHQSAQSRAGANYTTQRMGRCARKRH